MYTGIFPPHGSTWFKCQFQSGQIFVMFHLPMFIIASVTLDIWIDFLPNKKARQTPWVPKLHDLLSEGLWTWAFPTMSFLYRLGVKKRIWDVQQLTKNTLVSFGQQKGGTITRKYPLYDAAWWVGIPLEAYYNPCITRKYNLRSVHIIYV